MPAADNHHDRTDGVGLGLVDALLASRTNDIGFQGPRHQALFSSFDDNSGGTWGCRSLFEKSAGEHRCDDPVLRSARDWFAARVIDLRWSEGERPLCLPP